MSITKNPASALGPDEGGSVAFLLAQVGARAAEKFASRLEPLGLRPAHAGILRILGGASGTSQRDLAEHLGMFPSRLVLVLDEMERLGLVRRSPGRRDRRVSEVKITEAGRTALSKIAAVARAHSEDLTAGLSDQERATLGSILRRLAAEHGLTPGVHPGYRSLGRSE